MIDKIKSMLAEAQEEYDGLSVYENGLITHERATRKRDLHIRIRTLKEVLEVMENG